MATEQKVKKLPVMEIFGPTIQGEGAMAGVVTMFVRFGLCDYKCKLCDSMHAVDPIKVNANATWMTPEEIALGILQRVPKVIPYYTWVTFSGGNPCIHDLTGLINTLEGHGFKYAVETQGTLLPEWLSVCDNITVSPKGPGMGEEFEEDKFLQFLARFKHHTGFNVKVVVFSAQDLEFAQYINELMTNYGIADRMYLSLGNPFPPGFEKMHEEVRDELNNTEDDLKLRLMDTYRQLAEDLLQMPALHNVRFLPQLHVLAWGNKQGV